MARRTISPLAQAKMKKNVLKNLEKYFGILSPALKDTGASYYLHNKWISEDPEYAKKIDEITQMSIDYVEGKLIQLIKEGDRTCIIFYLKCKAKDRGYVEKYQIDQNIIEPIKINYNYPDETNRLLPDTETRYSVQLPE